MKFLMKASVIPKRQNMAKDKDKDKGAYIGLKEFISHMIMTQTKR